jgi:hypothetical protein
VLRRVDRLAAAGLYGAGVAILFLSAYAGHAWYGLFADRTAMALMGVAALLGAMLSHRSGLVAIAVLATIGGAIAPAVVRGQPSLTPFWFTSCFCRPWRWCCAGKNATRRWWALRGVALAATAVWTFVIAANSHQMGGADLTILLVGALVQAALFQAELIATTLRARLAEVAERAAGVVFSVLVTAALVVTILLATPHLDGPVQGSLLLAIAAACGVVGTWVRRYDRPAAGVAAPPPRLDALGQGLRWQAMALVTLAVPVALDGPAIVVAWALLAVLLAAAARRARSRAAVVTAYAVWVLSILAWAVWGQTAEGTAVWLSPGGVELSGRVVLAVVIAAAGHAVAVALARPESVNAPYHNVFHGLAAFVVLIAAWSWLGALPGAAMVIAYALLLAGASLTRVAAVLGAVAAVVWLVQTFEWTVFELLRPRVDRTARPRARRAGQLRVPDRYAADRGRRGDRGRRPAPAGGRRREPKVVAGPVRRARADFADRDRLGRDRPLRRHERGRAGVDRAAGRLERVVDARRRRLPRRRVRRPLGRVPVRRARAARRHAAQGRRHRPLGRRHGLADFVGRGHGRGAAGDERPLRPLRPPRERRAVRVSGRDKTACSAGEFGIIGPT